MKSVRMRCALAAVIMASAAAGQAQADTVLMKGPPALTQEMVDKTINVAEWGLGVQFSSAQRQQWRAILMEFWRKDSMADIGGVLELVEFDGRLQGMSAMERENLVRKARPLMLDQIRSNAATAIDDKFLLEVYEAWNDRPIIPARNGLPALTPSMLKDYAAIMEIAYDIRLDEAQRKMLDGHVVRVWEARDKVNIENVTGWVAKEKELRAMGPGMRSGIGRFDIYPAVIEQARKDAATDPEVRDLLAIHDEQHRPLAGGVNGEPGLQRREGEAFLGVLFFIASKAEGLATGSEIRPPLEVQDAFVEALRQNWGNLPAENKVILGQMPELYAKLQVLWDKSDAETQKSMIDAIGSSPQGQEVRTQVRSLAQAQAQKEKQLRDQRESSRASSAARAEAARAGRMTASYTAGAPNGPVTPPAPASLGAAASGKPQMSDFAKASHDLAMERMKTQMISNMMTQMHQTRMMVIYNTGGNGFEWKRR